MPIWTVEEEKTLKNLVGSMPLSRVASVMGRSKSSVLSKASSLGLCTRSRTISWNSENLKRLVYLRVEGKSWSEIAKQFKLSENGCKSAYHRHQEDVCKLLNEIMRDRISQVLGSHVSNRVQLKILKDLEAVDLIAHIKAASKV